MLLLLLLLQILLDKGVMGDNDWVTTGQVVEEEEEARGSLVDVDAWRLYEEVELFTL